VRYLKSLRSFRYLNVALARAASTSALRRIDLADPLSWEFSGFSQHGEDGIIDVLTSKLSGTNRYFVEIGAGDGTENNTSFLAIAKRYSGLMVDGDPKAAEWCQYLLRPINYGLDFLCMFVTIENVGDLHKKILFPDPDVFSIDIDGNDYWITKALLERGARPKIVVVEYNSAFGPEQSLTVPYKSNFHVVQAYRDSLYYGCSIAAWRKLFERFGYKFVTVESNGVNAFFINPSNFDRSFIEGIRGIDFQENHSHLREYKVGWEEQFKLVKQFDFQEI
jgi:hypothetical protein